MHNDDAGENQRVWSERQRGAEEGVGGTRFTGLELDESARCDGDAAAAAADGDNDDLPYLLARATQQARAVSVCHDAQSMGCKRPRTWCWRVDWQGESSFVRPRYWICATRNGICSRFVLPVGLLKQPAFKTRQRTVKWAVPLSQVRYKYTRYKCRRGSASSLLAFHVRLACLLFAAGM